MGMGVSPEPRNRDPLPFRTHPCQACSKCYSELRAMASPVAIPAASHLPADRFYRTALFFLVLTSVITLVATGKLDLFTTIAAPVFVLYKGLRWWRGFPAELPHIVATRLVVSYLFFFPIDAIFLSRSFAASSANPNLYSTLVADRKSVV